jgi:hypothetical protein
MMKLQQMMGAWQPANAPVDTVIRFKSCMVKDENTENFRDKGTGES